MDKNDTMYPIGIHLGYFWIFLKKNIFLVLKNLIEMVRFLKHFKMDIFWTKKKCPKKVANGQLFYFSYFLSKLFILTITLCFLTQYF